MAEEIIGRLFFFVQGQFKKIFRLRKCAHERAERFGKGKSAVGTLLHFAEHGASYARRRIFDFRILFGALAAIGKHLHRDLSALPSRKEPVNIAVTFFDLLFDILYVRFRIEIGKVFFRLRARPFFELPLKIDPLVFEHAEIKIFQSDRFYQSEFERFCKLVDKVVK